MPVSQHRRKTPVTLLAVSIGLALQMSAAAHAQEAAQTTESGQATPAQQAGYDRWVAHANNASFAAQAAYDEWVPAFEALFAQSGQRWQPFYDAVKELAALPQPERADRLRALLPKPVSPP